jgi:hypothetical protein
LQTYPQEFNPVNIEIQVSLLEIADLIGSRVIAIPRPMVAAFYGLPLSGNSG